MIHLGTNSEVGAPVVPVSPVRVIGIGSSGLAVLERLTSSGHHLMETVAMHADAQALMTSSSSEKLQIGREATRGLGAGGDAALGAAAAQECAEEIRAACRAPLVVICAGLGGGTGSGASYVVAQEAKNAGAMVLAIVTLPFVAEGQHRNEVARAALSKLGRHCLAVMCFENERMGELVDASAPVSEAFGTGAEVMADTVRSVARMVSLPSILHVGLDELSQVFRGSEARCSFGHGVARGPDRIAESVEKAFGSVLLDGGRVLSVAGSVLVQVTADASLPLSELREIMRLVHDRVSDAAHLYLGVSTDPSASDAVEVTIMAASPMGTSSAFEESIPAEETGEESGAETGKPTKAGARRKAGARKAEGAETQEELPLDQAIRGRFKDIDPTMVDGQDLDIPTFIRLRMRLK